MITYKDNSPYRPFPISVLLDGKKIGEIRYNLKQYRYVPAGSKKGGELYPTVEECKKSLEAE